MKRWFADILLLVVAMSLCSGVMVAAQAAAQHSVPFNQPSANHPHGMFPVELAKSLDSKKLKEGDQVEAKLVNSITLPDGKTLPRGTMLIGHITEAKARAKKDSESALGISFDKIALSGGEDLNIHSVIQAVAPNPDAGVTSAENGVGYTDLKEATDAPAPPPGSGQGPIPLLNEQSQGVLGIKNLQLGPGGVLTSTGKEVKLDSGTRMMLNVTM